MKKLVRIATIAALAGVTVLSACKSKCERKPELAECQTTPTPEVGNVMEVTGEITENTTWTADKVVLLKDVVLVKSGATLTIEPGTIIKGDKATKATLVIQRGAKIMAEGTAAEPIVFTSAQDKGTRDKGDWGGIILLGKAENSKGTDVGIEGLAATADYQYGGTTNDDNSGVMKYVRIEYAGVALSPNNEVNSLTFGGVGSNTTISYIQVSYAGDDAYEWFGGKVNCDHLVTFSTWDDDFDSDKGFSGVVQYGLIYRTSFNADQSGSNGFENDGDFAKTPYTTAVFANISVMGPSSEKGEYSANYANTIHTREGSGSKFLNIQAAGFPNGVLLDQDETITEMETRGHAMDNVFIACGRGSDYLDDEVSAAEVKTYFETSNTPILKDGGDPTLASIKTTTGVDLNAGMAAGDLASTPLFATLFTQPSTGVDDLSTMYSSAGLESAGATKVGAFGGSDWTATWTNFAPNSAEYTK